MTQTSNQKCYTCNANYNANEYYTSSITCKKPWFIKFQIILFPGLDKILWMLHVSCRLEFKTRTVGWIDTVSTWV